MKKTTWFMLSCFLSIPLMLPAAEVSLETLLTEMLDRSAVARYPDPPYTCKQVSSYDRKSRSPGDDWFANQDFSQFVREEMNGNRNEWVLLDAEGPGAIVRWWVTAPHYRTTIRIYIDGNAEPFVEAKADELIGGDFLVGVPLSAEKARGRNLYLPIPYAKRIKVTVDNMLTDRKETEQGKFYYQINYRTYPAGTRVESFSTKILEMNKPKIEQACRELSAKEGFTADGFRGEKGRIKPNDDLNIDGKNAGGGAIHVLAVTIKADDMAQALRSTILEIEFDDDEDHGGWDETTVFCPLGDFFGSGVGLNEYQSRYMSVEKNGTKCRLVSRWVMPFQEDWEVSLKNVGRQTIDAEISVITRPWQWDERSMYFHCNWRQERDIPTRPLRDWEYVKLDGRGVFVGDVLTLLNRAPDWWGEGDEKIYIDGETFPSHFGTGTEDYYGYAWASPQFFEAPFHAQPRVEGPRNYGNTTNLRTRSLDAIPFAKDFRFDMEIRHWNEQTTVDYAVATFWYGKPGTKAVGAPAKRRVVAEARLPVAYHSPKFVPAVKGFVFKSVPPGNVRLQRMKNFKDGTWKDDDQLLWTGAKSGDRLEIVVAAKKSGPQKLICAMTKAIDYGKVRFWLDGKKVGRPIDLFNNGVVATGDIVVGDVDVPAGEHLLGVEIVGKNEKSTNYFFGLDTCRFE